MKKLLQESIPTENIEIGKSINNLNKVISFDNISFGYSGNKDVLRDINFSIKPKNITAIYGESGIGKSTIADLVLRLQIPKKGTITISKENISKYNLLDWRSKIGYVSQDPFFYNMSILNNLSVGKSSIEMNEIINACKLVNAHNFILDLNHSYETIIGDRAISLSGGQKQRLALARALIRNPDILILDESTSALDAENEKK